jgi:hypothetical protein
MAWVIETGSLTTKDTKEHSAARPQPKARHGGNGGNGGFGGCVAGDNSSQTAETLVDSSTKEEPEKKCRPSRGGILL